MRNKNRVVGIVPKSSQQFIDSPHAVYLGHESVTETTPTELAATSFGDGDIAPGNLTMQGTLGTAFSANAGWVTLTGVDDHCFAESLETGKHDQLYSETGGLLMFGQFNANMTAGTVAGPTLCFIGNRDATVGESYLSLGIDRADKVPRLSYKSAEDSIVRTTDGDTNSLFTDSVTQGIAAWFDFTNMNYIMFSNGALNETGVLSNATGNTFAPAFDPSNSKNRFAIGGGWVDGASTFSFATMWEGQIRRVGMIGFQTVPSNIEAIVQELHNRNYVPFGLKD